MPFILNIVYSNVNQPNVNYFITLNVIAKLNSAGGLLIILSSQNNLLFIQKTLVKKDLCVSVCVCAHTRT